MKYEDVKAAWNAQADQFNQWDMLSSEEIVKFAMSIEREECAKICDSLAKIEEAHGESALEFACINCAKFIRSKQ